MVSRGKCDLTYSEELLSQARLHILMIVLYWRWWCLRNDADHKLYKENDNLLSLMMLCSHRSHPRDWLACYLFKYIWAISPPTKKTLSSSFISVIVVSIRIPMDVSQLDKSDSESESDWWCCSKVDKTFDHNNNNKVNQMFDRNPSSVKGKLRKVLSRSPGSVFSNCNHMPSIIHHFAKCTLRQHYVQDFFVAHLSPAYLPTNRSDFLKSAIRSFLTRHCWLVGRFPTWLLCVNFVLPLGRCLGCPHVSNVATPCCKMPFWPPMMSFCHLSF